jgi:hypothetical protein
MSRSDATTLRVDKFADVEVLEETRPGRPGLLLGGPELTTEVDDCPWWLSELGPAPDLATLDDFDDFDDFEPTDVQPALMVFAPEPAEEAYLDGTVDPFDEVSTCVYEKRDLVSPDEQRADDPGEQAQVPLTRSNESPPPVEALSKKARLWWWRRCLMLCASVVGLIVGVLVFCRGSLGPEG